MTSPKPMTARVVTFVILVLALGVAAILARNVMGARARAARSDVAAVVKGLSVPPDTATATPGFERARARRLAVDEMQSMLTALVSAESALVVDSGFPRALPGRAYWSRPMGNNLGPYIRVSYDGWLAWTGNTHADVWCAVAVGPDTQWFGNAPSRKPVCFGTNLPRPDLARIGQADYQRHLRAAQSQPR